MKPLRIVLADDHPIVLAGIAALLRTSPDLTVAGEAQGGQAALAMLLELRPDIAVIDVSMPDMSGLDLARRAAAECPDVKLLVLTVHEDDSYVQPLLQAGARGYLLKRSAAEDLLRAIHAIAGGGVFIDPAIAGRVLAASRSGKPSTADRDRAETLSPREVEVMRLVAQGFSNKEIAARLDLSVKTAETYKARGADKLQLRTRAEITRYGLSQGWLDSLTRT